MIKPQRHFPDDVLSFFIEARPRISADAGNHCFIRIWFYGERECVYRSVQRRMAGTLCSLRILAEQYEDTHVLIWAICIGSIVLRQCSRSCLLREIQHAGRAQVRERPGTTARPVDWLSMTPAGSPAVYGKPLAFLKQLTAHNNSTSAAR